MRLRGVVDEGGVDQVLAIADEAQPPRLRTLHQPRQDLLVARPPDQPRAQRDRREARTVGSEHGFLGDGLGGRVRRLEILAVRDGLGGAACDRMGGAMGHAGRGGVDQPADAVRAAGVEHVPGADHIGLVIALVAAPRAGLRGVVEDRVEAARECGHDRIAVGEVSGDLAHADGIQRRVMAAVEAGDFVAAFDQAAAQGLAEKSTAAGDQDLHVISKGGCSPKWSTSRGRSWRCGGCRPGTASGSAGTPSPWRCARSRRRCGAVRRPLPRRRRSPRA